MSGTKFYMDSLRTAESARIAAESARIAAEAAAAENLAAVKERLTALVKEAAGWSGIADWAKSVIDRALAGETIDLDALDAEITAWKAAQTTESAETTETTETSESGV